MIYDISGNILSPNSNINCKITAHRGYHVTATQNTIEAFKQAAENGFNWIEVDIRKCADGIYVMSHDASVTLYNNGSSVSVNIPNSNYETIKNYTWDSAGRYKLCTLQAVFNAMMIYDMNMICDLKNGSNTDIMNIASLCGAVDKVLLSYSSFQAAYNDRNLLLKYGNVPIRCIPSDYTNFTTLASAISNPIYADVNASETAHYQQYLNIALSCGVPIIFSGCTTSNYNIWSVLANGCMANLNLNITYEQFYDLLNNDYDNASTITPSAQSISIAINGTSTLTGASDLDGAGGYVYGYSENPSVATVKQTGFGKTATITVTGKSSGSTNIKLFDGCGEIVTVPVTVL
jgi:hypothetical protein